jgi:hydrogenase maturation protein HypF
LNHLKAALVIPITTSPPSDHYDGNAMSPVAEPVCPTLTRRRLNLTGVVQGVGFRPYIYRLAKQFDLTGNVRNTSSGAIIEIEGDESAIEAFLDSLPCDAPPLMHIATIDSTSVSLKHDQTFTILASETTPNATAMVPSDIAPCAACLAEIHDPANRRFGYPFTNCTNCGPRYSIILDVPYDRAQTTMANFPMCPACRAEYVDPTNRRFHAQPIACPTCGPHLSLTDPCGKPLPIQGTRPILETVANLLRTGGIVALKALGGYQLACDAANDAAVRQLRLRKHRDHKPFAVMVADAANAAALCILSPEEHTLLTSPAKPIVLLTPQPNAPISPNVAPNNPSLGVMLPSTPLHDLLFHILGQGAVLVMTSGNLADEPIVLDQPEAQARLSTIADLYLHHNRPIHNRVDDSVTRIVHHRQTILRRARGYTPSNFPIAGTAELLACGAQQKSTFCLTRNGSAILSQHLGDLENYETLAFYQQTLDRTQQLFHITPQTIAHDLHPTYLSTQLALSLPAQRHIAIQHHHAHIAACMAEHSLVGPVIGIAWDGTGYGPDSTLWGGEFLIADLHTYTRRAHLRTLPLPGGDTAIRQPWRTARSYLHDAFDGTIPPQLRPPASIPETSLHTIDTMLQRHIQSIPTSSCGRLFDAVASILNLHQAVSFEGQAAITLEAIADNSTGAYPYTIGHEDPIQIDLRPTLRQIAHDHLHAGPPGQISARFHNTLVAIANDIAHRLRTTTGLNRVCLSGGCFQNARLLRGTIQALERNGFQVFHPQQLPANDGGIALGQAAIACAQLQRGA